MVENNDTTLYVCALTGYVSSAPMLRDDYWKPHATPWQGSEGGGGASASFTTLSAPGWRDRNVERRLASSMYIIFSAQTKAQIQEFLVDRRRSATHQSRREDYLTLAAAKIALLFTQQRLVEARQASRRVEAQVRDLLESYVTLVQQSGQRLAMTEALRVAALLRSRAHRGGLVVRSIPEEARRALIMDWARRCVCFWVILMRYTSLGRAATAAATTTAAVPQPPPVFLNFIDVAIHLFADGVVVPTTPTPTVLLYPEPLVHMYAVYAQEAGGGGDSLTRLKTRIQRAIVDAVMVEHVAPARLRLESISFEQCLDDYLAPLTRARARAPKRTAAEAATEAAPPPHSEDD